MALLRNREVSILSKADGQDVSPVYTVIYADGNRENVMLKELELTQEEHDEMTKQNGDASLENVRKVDTKHLQDVRDGQDKNKIESSKKKELQYVDVPVSKVKVDSREVEKAKH